MGWWSETVFTQLVFSPLFIFSLFVGASCTITLFFFLLSFFSHLTKTSWASFGGNNVLSRTNFKNEVFGHRKLWKFGKWLMVSVLCWLLKIISSKTMKRRSGQVLPMPKWRRSSSAQAWWPSCMVCPAAHWCIGRCIGLSLCCPSVVSRPPVHLLCTHIRAPHCSPRPHSVAPFGRLWLPHLPAGHQLVAGNSCWTASTYPGRSPNSRPPPYCPSCTHSSRCGFSQSVWHPLVLVGLLSHPRQRL